jgi:hypothetical protein
VLLAMSWPVGLGAATTFGIVLASTRIVSLARMRRQRSDPSSADPISDRARCWPVAGCPDMLCIAGLRASARYRSLPSHRAVSADRLRTPNLA